MLWQTLNQHVSFLLQHWSESSPKQVLADLEAYWEKWPSVGHDTFSLISLYLPLALRWKIIHGHSVIITRHFSQRSWGFKQRNSTKDSCSKIMKHRKYLEWVGELSKKLIFIVVSLHWGLCQVLCVCVCVFSSVILFIKIFSLIEKHLLCASWMSNSVR